MIWRPKFFPALLLSLFFVLPVWADDAPVADKSANYYVPPQQLNAQLQVGDQGFATIFALFRNGTASFTFNEGSKSISRLRIAIDTTSLITSNDESRHDLYDLLNGSASAELAVAAPDSVTFADGKAEIKGNLSLHGISKPVILEALLNRTGKNTHAGGMWSSAGDVVGLSLKTSFKRADFNLTENVPADGQSRFGDTITLLAELQGIQQ